MLARRAGRAPRPRRQSRGSAGSARRPRPAPGPTSPVRPAITIDSGGASGQSPSARSRLDARASRRRFDQRARGRLRSGVDAASRPRPARCRRRAASARPRPQLLPPHPRQPERRRVGDRGGLGGRVVAEQRRGQLAALAGRPAQHRVDEAGGVGGAGALDQLDRLVDGGVVGRAVGEEQLVEAEAQRRPAPAGRAAGSSARRGARSRRRWCRGAARRRRRAAAPGRARDRRARAARRRRGRRAR